MYTLRFSCWSGGNRYQHNYTFRNATIKPRYSKSNNGGRMGIFNHFINLHMETMEYEVPCLQTVGGVKTRKH